MSIETRPIDISQMTKVTDWATQIAVTEDDARAFVDLLSEFSTTLFAAGPTDQDPESPYYWVVDICVEPTLPNFLQVLEVVNWSRYPVIIEAEKTTQCWRLRFMWVDKSRPYLYTKYGLIF